MRGVLAGVLAVALAGPALGQVGQIPAWPPTQVVSSGGSYTGPGDVASNAITGFYSIARAFSSATRGQKVANLCNALDVVCADIFSDATTGIVSSTDIIGAVTCGSGANLCTIKTLYDQTGNGRDVTQATPANRLNFKPSCSGSLPCAEGLTTGLSLVGPSWTPNSNNLMSSLLVGNPDSNGVAAMKNMANINSAEGPDASNANFIMLGGSSGSITASSGGAGYHSVAGTINGASSFVNVDGTETTGTVVNAHTAGVITVFQDNSGTAVSDMMEFSFADGVAWTSGTSGVASHMCANAAAFYTAITAGTNCVP